MYRVSIAISAIVLTLFQAAGAWAEGWTVSKIKQPVNYTLDKYTWMRLNQGMEVPAGAWISTGPRGRVVLVHDEDMVTVQPGTLTAIFAKDRMGKKFEIAQQIGEVLVDFESATDAVFRPDPFLAAVVKGPSLPCGSTARAPISVLRAVSSASRSPPRQAVDVRPGQSVAVSSTTTGSLSVVGPVPRLRWSTWPSPALPSRVLPSQRPVPRARARRPAAQR
jgi:hypothetical protein